MKFISDIPDKKTLLKPESSTNPFLIENNIDKIEEILRFFKERTSTLLINGFMGTGKTETVNHAVNFLNNDTIILKYNCFETTILDDILLEFFDTFKKLTTQNVIESPKIKTENFTQKINSYFETINKPILVIINSFEQILKANKPDILNFIHQLSKSYKIKIILIGRKFDYYDFEQKYQKLSITAFEKSIFEKYLRTENIKQIGPLSDEMYKQTRGYYFYTKLSIKIMKEKKYSLSDFLAEFSKSFLSFNDFILREVFSLVDPVSGHLFRFLTLIRHPVSIKLLEALNLYDEERVNFFVDNLLLIQENSLIYLQDYYKTIFENSIAENIAVKIHKSCVELYETQLPLKPLERDILISRQTMRKEIEFHSLFIPKKPVIMKKPEIQPIQTPVIPVTQPTIQEKDEQIKQISFVFDSEADEMAIMNKIATSINKFVDVSDKNIRTINEIQNLSLIELINLAKQEELNFDYQKAIMIYQKALTMNTDEDFYTFLPTLYTKLGESFKNISDWFNAQKYYELAVEFYVSTGDNEKICEIKYEIANVFYITFKPDKAETLLEEILSDNINTELEIKSKLLLSAITGEWYIDISPENFASMDKTLISEVYYKYGAHLDKMGAVEKAVRYYKKCIEISQDRLVNQYLSSSLTNLATIYDEEGKSDMAIKYLQESLRLDELSKNYNGIYVSSMKLAEINKTKHPDKTIEFLKKAKKCGTELNDKFYIASADVAFGDFYYEKREFKKALSHYNNAYMLANKNFTKDNINKISKRIEDIKKVYNEK